MSTSADFYVGGEYLGSVGAGGYPQGISAKLRKARTPTEFRQAVANIITSGRTAYLPSNPFGEGCAVRTIEKLRADRATGSEHYTYVFDKGAVLATNTDRHGWFKAAKQEPRWSKDAEYSKQQEGVDVLAHLNALGHPKGYGPGSALWMKAKGLNPYEALGNPEAVNKDGLTFEEFKFVANLGPNQWSDAALRHSWHLGEDPAEFREVAAPKKITTDRINVMAAKKRNRVPMKDRHPAAPDNFFDKNQQGLMFHEWADMMQLPPEMVSYADLEPYMRAWRRGESPTAINELLAENLATPPGAGNALATVFGVLGLLAVGTAVAVAFGGKRPAAPATGATSALGPAGAAPPPSKPATPTKTAPVPTPRPAPVYHAPPPPTPAQVMAEAVSTQKTGLTSKPQGPGGFASVSMPHVDPESAATAPGTVILSRTETPAPGEGGHFEPADTTEAPGLLTKIADFFGGDGGTGAGS